MNKRLQKQIHPGVAAVLVLIVLAVIQGVWWRGLVYKEKLAPPGRGGGGAAAGPENLNILGRSDVGVDTFAGDREPGDADGMGYNARFDRPTGLALDPQGNLYIADTGNHRIRKISPDGETTTLAGSEEGFADGPALQARFHAPCDISVAPDGAVYVADTGNHCIRRIQNGQVTTVAGKPTGAPARISEQNPDLLLPTGVAFVPNASPFLLVADAGEKQLKTIRLDGSIQSRLAVSGPPTAVIGTPQTGVAIAQTGTLQIGQQTLHNVPIAGAERVGAVLHHPVRLSPLGNGWLVTDSDHGAVFLIRDGKAEVIAGYYSSGGAIRGLQDGDGSKSRFNIMSGVATDGKRLAYIADTANNCIRRLRLPESIEGNFPPLSSPFGEGGRGRARRREERR